MQYKLPERYRGSDPFLPALDGEYKKTLKTFAIDSIEQIDKNHDRYDIETETHNFFANGVLVHNSNCRYTYQDGKLWAGSRNFWRKRDKKNNEWYHKLINRLTLGRYCKPGIEKCDYWRVVDENPWVRRFCEDHPGLILFGEMFGDVQDLKYGTKPGQILFRAFDVYSPSEKMFWNAERRYFCFDKYYDYQYAPVIAIGEYSKEFVEKHISGPSLIPGASHLREGVVIKPLYTEWDDLRIGRAILKAVSPEYLERAK